MTKRKLAFVSVSSFQVLAAMFIVPNLIGATDIVQTEAVTDATKWGYICAMLSVGICCIASAYAVAKIGSAGIGAMAEKPELMGRAVVFLGLAEGIAIYGLIIAVMILNKL